MLAECYRILNPGGKIRIATPDLLFLINLYKSNKSELQKRYIKWAIDFSVPNTTYYDDTFVINNFFADWGHKFIYDDKVLRFALEKVGFTNITKCNLNESEDRELRGLENENRMPDGFLQLETIILEGTKGYRPGQ
jgi:predicted SAM-dependent methyltransferase